QIGVFSKPTTSVQLYNINPLNSEKTVDGFIRYTTGKFTDEKAAIKAKNNIVSKGIKDAFVVAYYNGKRISINQAKGLVSAEGEQIITKGKQENPVFNSNTSSTPSGSPDKNIVFKVQIGAYKEKVPIEEANRLLRFANSGIKTFTDEGGLMIYTVGEFTDYQEANSLKAQLISQGLTDAFVIGMKNGKKISASEMLQFTK
ncbi:MAG TPA: SPOR domain-containing protein, partial [Bacteroidia bacterium]|nr:SPOR domain-containing protein [Bacteroidia bacterium]